MQGCGLGFEDSVAARTVNPQPKDLNSKLETLGLNLQTLRPKPISLTPVLAAVAFQGQTFKIEV